MIISCGKVNKTVLPKVIVLVFLLAGVNNILAIELQTVQSNDSLEEKLCEGYVLCSVVPFMLLGEGHHALLIDMNGTEINRWNTIPDPAKMLPGGSIISATGEYIDEWDSTNLTQLSWTGEVEWDFSGWVKDDTGRDMAREHHDFQREGNPVGYYAPNQEFVSNGKTLILGHNTVKNTDVSRRTITDDVIYEVDWYGDLTGFEWHASEHIDEMGFNNISRIGIWLNPGGPALLLGCLPGDWIHINSISYLGENKWFDAGDERFNPDNIIISSRNANFIAIISKETGEIVWRIGPYYPKTSEEGSKLGKIIGLHHAHIIPKGLPGEGNILLFDNGGIAGYGLLGFANQIRFYSRVLEFNPITFEIVQEYKDRCGLYPYPRNGEIHMFFSATMGSVQRLPNGNTLVTESLSGRVFEITPENDVVWDYVTPDRRNVLYRAYMIPPEWVPGNPANYTFWGNLY